MNYICYKKFKGLSSPADNLPTTGSGGGWGKNNKKLGDTKVGQIISMLLNSGMQASEIYKNFKNPSTAPAVVVDKETGQRVDMHEFYDLVGQQAKTENRSSDDLLKFMLMQMQQQNNNNSNNKSKDNLPIYIGLGVLGIVLIGGVIIMSSKK